MNMKKSGETYCFLDRQPGRPILLEHLHHTLRLEICSHSLVGARKDDTIHSIELFKFDRWRWVDGNKADYGGLDLRWWAEIITRNVDDIIDFRIELFQNCQS